MKKINYHKWLSIITLMATIIFLSVISIAYIKSDVRTDYLSSNNIKMNKPTLITFYKKGCSYCNAAKPGLTSDLSIAKMSGLNVYLLDDESNEAKKIRINLGLSQPYTGIVYWNKNNETTYTYSFSILKQDNHGKFLKKYNNYSVQEALNQLQMYNNEYDKIQDMKKWSIQDTREVMKLHKKEIKYS